MAALSVEELQSQLPNVGDMVVKEPVMGKHLGICDSRAPRLGQVTYVNREHLWYRVQFMSGYREIYKLPEIQGRIRDYNTRSRRVKCVETGAVYKTIAAAAKAAGCSETTIRKACKYSGALAGGLHWRFAY